MENSGVSFVHVGTSPSGVEYNVYTHGKSPEKVREEVETQRRRLAAMAAKHERGLVTVKLSAAALDYIDAYYSEADADEELAEDFPKMTRGKTFIRASRRVLRNMALVLAEMEDDAAEMALSDYRHDTANEAEFAERAVRTCFQTAIRKIEKAIA